MDLPIYLAEIQSEEDGLFVMSLVTCPATEKDWICYDSDKQVQRFAIQDEEEHILCGVVMLADTPIYRRDAEGREYYIKYSKETLKVMAEKMLFDNTANNIDLQHNGELLPKGVVALRELFIKDVEKGINPINFEDVADGSLLCTYKINNNELWELCKNGEFNGFSLEGMFSVTKEVFQKVEEIKENKVSSYMSKLKEILAKIIMDFGSVTTDKGELIYEGEELAEGVSVSVEDGEYIYDDKVITVKDGVVESIAEKKEEEPSEEAVEETVEEEMSEETVEEEVVAEEEAIAEEETVEETPNEVEELKGEIEALKGEIEAIKGQLAEIVSVPTAEPIAEEFSKINETPSKSNLGVFGYLNK